MPTLSQIDAPYSAPTATAEPSQPSGRIPYTLDKIGGIQPADVTNQPTQYEYQRPSTLLHVPSQALAQIREGISQAILRSTGDDKSADASLDAGGGTMKDYLLKPLADAFDDYVTKNGWTEKNPNLSKHVMGGLEAILMMASDPANAAGGEGEEAKLGIDAAKSAGMHEIVQTALNKLKGLMPSKKAPAEQIEAAELKHAQVPEDTHVEGYTEQSPNTEGGPGRGGAISREHDMAMLRQPDMRQQHSLSTIEQYSPLEGGGRSTAQPAYEVKLDPSPGSKNEPVSEYLGLPKPAHASDAQLEWARQAWYENQKAYNKVVEMHQEGYRAPESIIPINSPTQRLLDKVDYMKNAKADNEAAAAATESNREYMESVSQKLKEDAARTAPIDDRLIAEAKSAHGSDIVHKGFTDDEFGRGRMFWYNSSDGSTHITTEFPKPPKKK